MHWVFAAEIEATYEELRSSGARIVEPLEKKPWGLRQFTVEDIDGNRFYFHWRQLEHWEEMHLESVVAIAQIGVVSAKEQID